LAKRWARTRTGWNATATRAVATTAEIGAILIEFLNASPSPGKLKTFFHQASVNPQNFAFWRSNGTSLNPYRIITKIGLAR